MHFSLVKRGWRGMFSFGSIARVHPLFVFKYFFYTSKSDDIITEKVQVNVVNKAVGQISENDVMLASASDAVIVGFQVRPPSLNG